jgi:hypothetical protein
MLRCSALADVLRQALIPVALVICFGAPPIALSATAVRLGEIDLGGTGAILVIRATPDGRRAVVVVRRSDSVAEVHVVDTSQPDTPQLEGSVAIDVGKAEGVFMQMALSPDGRRALFANRTQEINKSYITLVDLSDPKAPSVLWRKEITALGTFTGLADDASAYAATTPSGDQRYPFSIVVTSLSGQVKRVNYDGFGPGSVALSGEAKYLLSNEGSKIRTLDLRGPEPVAYVEDMMAEYFKEHPDDDSGTSYKSKYGCAVPRDDGTILANSNTTQFREKLAVLRIENPGFLHLNTPSFDVPTSRICMPLNHNNTARDWFYWDDKGMVVRLDLLDPEHPSIDGYWDDRGSFTSAVAASMLFGQAGPRTFQISRLEWADRRPVDWQKLDTAYTEAMQRAVEMKKNGKDPTNVTVAALEAAGIFNAISAPVAGITKQRAALILRDYGAIMRGAAGDNVATSALQRARLLDPVSDH